jgi:hypothetical protein
VLPSSDLEIPRVADGYPTDRAQLALGKTVTVCESLLPVGWQRLGLVMVGLTLCAARTVRTYVLTYTMKDQLSQTWVSELVPEGFVDLVPLVTEGGRP